MSGQQAYNYSDLVVPVYASCIFAQIQLVKLLSKLASLPHGLNQASIFQSPEKISHKFF